MSTEEDHYRRELQLVDTPDQMRRIGTEPYTIRLRTHQNDRQFQDSKLSVSAEELESLRDQLATFFDSERKVERIESIERMIDQWAVQGADAVSLAQHDIEEKGIYAFSQGFLLNKLGTANARAKLIVDLKAVIGRFKAGEKTAEQTIERIIERTRNSMNNPWHGNPHAQAVALDQAEAMRQVLYVALGIEAY